MDELYELNGEQYTFNELQQKYGDKVNDKIAQHGFKKINQNIYSFKGEDYSEKELRTKYGENFDAKIKEHGFELKKKEESDSTEVQPNSELVTEPNTPNTTSATQEPERPTDIPTDDFEAWKKEFYAKNKDAINSNDIFAKKFTKKEELSWDDAENLTKKILPALDPNQKITGKQSLIDRAKTAKTNLIQKDEYIKDVLMPQIAVQNKQLFTDKQKELAEKYNLNSKDVTQENLTKAEQEYNKFANETLNQKLIENPEFKDRYQKYSKKVNEDYERNYTNYRRKEEIPAIVRFNPVIEGLYKTIYHSFGDKVPTSIGALGNSKMINDNQKQIQHLEDRLTNGTLKESDEIGFTLGGKYDKTTVKEKQDLLQEEKSKLEMSFVNKLTDIKDVEDEMSIFKSAEMFDEKGLSLTLSDIGTMIGDQLPQVGVALLTFGIGNSIQETSDSYISNLRAIASKKFNTDNPTNEQLLEIVEANEDGKAVAVTTGAIVGYLERIGAGGQLKALMANKKIMGSLLKGEFKAFIKKGAYATGTNLKSGFGEFLTEGSQTLTSQLSQSYMTGDLDISPKELAESMGQGLLIGTLFPFAGNFRKQTLIEKRAINRKIASSFDEEHQEHYFRAAEIQTNKDFEDGNITKDEFKSAIEDLRSVRNSKEKIPNHYSPKNKTKAIDLIIKKQGLEKAIEGKDKNLIQTELAEIALIDVQLGVIDKREGDAKQTTKADKELFALPDRGVKLKEEAAKILTEEKQNAGKKEFQLTNDEITKKASELLKEQNDKTAPKTTEKNKVDEVLPKEDKNVKVEEKNPKLKEEIKQRQKAKEEKSKEVVKKITNEAKNPKKVKVQKKVEPTEIKHESKTVEVGKRKARYKVNFKEDGTVEILNKKGKTPSKPTIKKVQLKLAEDMDFTLGQKSTEVKPSIIDKDYSDDKHIADNSENPSELAELIVKVEEDLKIDDTIDPTTRTIIDFLKGKVRRGKTNKKGEATRRDSGFVNESGSEHITNGIGRTYLNKNGSGLDVLAQELSEILKQNITVDKLVSIIQQFPNGESSLLKESKDKILNPAKDKFTAITQLPATKEFLDMAIKAPAKKEAKQKQDALIQEEQNKKEAESGKGTFTKIANVGIAPAYERFINHLNEVGDALKKKDFGEKLQKTIKEAAEALNITIITNNPAAGGWQINNKILKEGSYKLVVDYKNRDQLFAFANLIGSLAPEMQDGVYVSEYDDAGIDREYQFEFHTIEQADKAVDALKDFGLGDGFTFDTKTNKLYIGDLEDGNLEKIRKFINFAKQNGLKDAKEAQTNITFPQQGHYREALQGLRSSVLKNSTTKRDGFNSLYQQAKERLAPKPKSKKKSTPKTKPKSKKKDKGKDGDKTQASTQSRIKELVHERIPPVKRPPSKKPLKKLNQIIADAANALKATLIYGKSQRRRSAGDYNPTNALVRIKQAGDLDTTAHELGHLIDDRHDVVSASKSLPNSKAISKQIKWFRDRGGSNPPAKMSNDRAENRRLKAQYREREGLAEFIRAFVVNPNEAKLIAPDLYAHFINTVPTETIKALEVLSEDIINHENADEGDQIISNIETSLLPKKKGIKEWFKKWRTDNDRFSVNPFDKTKEAMTNSMAIVNKAYDFALNMSGIDKLLPHDDFRILSRLFAGINGKTTTMLTRGLTNANLDLITDEKGMIMNIDYLFESLDSTTDKTMQAEMEDVIKLLVAERTAEYAEKFDREFNLTGVGAGTKSDLRIALGHLRNFESLKETDIAKYERIKEGARRYRAFADAGLRYAVEKGRFSEKQYAQIKQTNQYYVSLARTKETVPTEELLPFLSDTNKISAVKEVIKKAKGGSDMIKNPYTSLIENTMKFVKEADRNEVMQKFTEPLSKDRWMGEGEPIDFSKIGSEVAAGSNNTLKVYRDGNLEHWLFQKDIHETIKGYGEIKSNLFLDVVAKPADLIRFTVTNFPVFAARNAFRDTFARLVLSRTDSGLFDFTFSKENREMFEMFGGGQAGFYLTSKNEYMTAMAESIKKITKNGGFVLDPRKLNWRNYQKLLQKGENLNRLAEYKSSLKRAKKEGMSDYDAKLYAAFQGRDLLDFAVAGTWMRQINRVLPFTNANVQGVKRAVKGITKNPASFAVKTAIYTIMPQLLMRALMSEEDEEEYRQLPDYQRDLFWNFRTPFTGDAWITLPKPFELGLGSSTIDRLYSKVVRGDENAFEGFIGSSYKSLLPFDEASLLGSFKPLVEAGMNYDMFRDRNVIPFYEVGKYLDKREGTQYASRVGKALTEAFGFVGLNFDPRKIDHVIKGYTTYYGDWALSMGDIGRDDTRYEFNKRKTGFAKDRPISNSKSVSRAYGLAKKMGKDNSKQVKTLRAMVKMYYNLDDDQIKEKRVLSKEIYKYADETTKYLKALRKEELKEAARLKKEKK